MNKDSKDKNNQSGASRDNLRPPTKTNDPTDPKDIVRNTRWVEIFTKGGISSPYDFEFINTTNDDRPPQNPTTTT